MTPFRTILTVAVAVALAAAARASAAAIYVSEAGEDAPKFASHPHDASYRLLIADEAPGPVLVHTASAGRSGRELEARRAALEPHIARVAAKHAVDAALVRAVIEVESRFHPGAVSPKGAVGPMQLMPDTARRYAVADRRDAAQNIEGGVRYLKDLLARFEGNVALAAAAYNAGEHAVDRHGRVIPRYRETMLYVPQVLEAYLRYRGPEARSER